MYGFKINQWILTRVAVFIKLHTFKDGCLVVNTNWDLSIALLIILITMQSNVSRYDLTILKATLQILKLTVMISNNRSAYHTYSSKSCREYFESCCYAET